MANGNEQAEFAINLEGNLQAAAKEGAEAMVALKESIAGGVSRIREMNGSLRNLRGSTADIVAAKEELRARIKAEQQAISSATLETIKAQKAHGTLGNATKKLVDEKKKLTGATDVGKARTKALDAAMTTAGGPVAALRDRLKGLKEIMGENGAGGKAAFLALGVGVAAAAIAAMGVAVIGTLASLARFVLTAADGARSARLMREAAMGGNAKWGENFGEQVDALSKRVPTARAELDKLGAALAANHIGGQTWVDAMNAVAQASAALGDTAGNKIKEFIERGRQFQRFQINPQEMIGSGVTFTEVADELAKSMKIGVDKAKVALFEGRVKLGDGAAALRAAVEKKFGAINLRQMLSLDVLARKLGETFDDLTKGINLEPLLAGLKDLASVFDLNTASGQALKQIVGVFGNDLVGTLASGTPLVKKFIYGLILGAQNVTIAYLTVRNSLRKTFGGDTLKGIDKLSMAVTAGKVAIAAFGVAALAVGGVLALAAAPLALFAAPFVLLGVAVYGAVKAFQSARKTIGEWFDDLKKVDLKATGAAIVDGLVLGITAGWTKLKKAISGLGESIKSTFKDTLGIHSPSKAFAEFGEHTTAGYEQGVERGSGDAQSAINGMVAPPRGGGGGGARAGGGAPVIHIHIHASGASAKEIAAQISSASVLEQITKAVIDALQQAGVPVPS